MEIRKMRRIPALAAGIAVLLVMTACGEKPEESTAPEPKQPAAYAPKLDTEVLTDTVTVPDSEGATVTLLLSVETPRLTGVDAPISDSLDAAFEATVSDFVEGITSAIATDKAEWLSCGSATACEIPVDVTLPIAELFEDTVTLTLDQSAPLGGSNRLSVPASVTLNLRTGKERQLSEYIDVADSAVQNAVSTYGLNEMYKNPSCPTPGANFELDADSVWSPTSEGLVVTFDDLSSGVARACGTLRITIPWPGGNELSAVAFPLSCDELLPPSELAENAKVSQSGDDFTTLTEAYGYGPVAVEAFATATGVMNCSYHIPNTDFIIGFSILDMPQESRDRLLAGLRDSVYTEGAHTPAGGSPVPTFIWDPQGEFGPGVRLSYAFVDRYVYTSPRGGESVLPKVAERLQQAAAS